MSACCWQADKRIIAHCSDGFQCHVAGSLDGPFIVLFEEQGTDQSDDGVVVGKDADDLCPPLDLAIQALDRICAVKLGPVLPGKGHVGKHVLLGAVHERGEFGHLRPDLIGDIAPLGACGLRCVLGKGRCDEGGDDTPSSLSCMGQGIAHEMNPGAVEKGLSF